MKIADIMGDRHLVENASLQELNAHMAELDARRLADVRAMFDDTFMDDFMDTREALANALGAEPGGLVLELKRKDGTSLGAFISPEPDNSGRWRITWFDQRGFSGDTQRATKAACIIDAMKEGYRDTNRNLLRVYAKLQSFQDGNEQTERMRAYQAGKP